MKRALLIMAGFLITAGFTIYILGVDPFSNSGVIGKAGSINDTMAVKTTGNEELIASNENAAPLLADMLNDDDIAQTTQTIENSGNAVPGWRLIWVDEFDKPNLNIERWTEVDRKYGYNNELQYYLPKNSYIKDGCLYLTAIKENWNGREYTSAMVDTGYKLVFRYGRIEARIKLPKGEGVFPAFWMLTNDGGYEIDIMEMIGSEPNTIYGTNHYETNIGSKKKSGNTANYSPEEFHTYAVEWEEDCIRWYLDGAKYHESTEGVPPDYMYIVLNLAIGGNWPGDPDNTSEFPCSMAVDYVKIYTRDSGVSDKLQR